MVFVLRNIHGLRASPEHWKKYFELIARGKRLNLRFIDWCNGGSVALCRTLPNLSLHTDAKRARELER